MVKKVINGSDEGIYEYIKDIKSTQHLTQEEEIEIAKRIQKGDEDAINELVEANLKFVITVAKDYQYYGIPLIDLISEGNYGLVVAAKRFDYTKGFKFISYAVWWIKQAILQSLNDNSRTIRLPVNVVTKISEINKEIEKFESKFDREPSHDEVERIYYPSCTSINEYINDDGDEMGDVLCDDNIELPDELLMGNVDLREKINNLLCCLDEREKYIIECYYGLNGDSMTLEMIGDELGLTKERIRQIKDKSIRKLRHNLY